MEPFRWQGRKLPILQRILLYDSIHLETKSCFFELSKISALLGGLFASSPLVNFRPDFADVDWVAVALALSVAVDVVRVLPGLRNGAVVPDVALVREAVGHEAQLALFHVLKKIHFVDYQG